MIDDALDHFGSIHGDRVGHGLRPEVTTWVDAAYLTTAVMIQPVPFALLRRSTWSSARVTAEAVK
jgi:hypothetical protein